MRSGFITSVVIALFLAAAARAVTSKYEDRRRQLAADAEAERARLGLDPQKLYARYPTPEVSLDGEAPTVACGGTASVRVTGAFPKGTAFLLNDDDVQLVDQKESGGAWQAKLAVAGAATPRDVNLHAIAPVTGAERSQRVLRIRGRYDVELRFDDGWTARFTTARADPDSGQLEGDLAWKKGAESRTTPARIDWSGARMNVQWQRSEEEMAALNDASTSLQSLGGEEVMKKVMGRVEECMKKAEAARAPCLQSVQKQNDADLAALKKKSDAALAAADAKRPTAAWACSDLQATAAGGALTGTATCAPKERKAKVTGTVKCLGAALRE